MCPECWKYIAYIAISDTNTYFLKIAVDKQWYSNTASNWPVAILTEKLFCNANRWSLSCLAVRHTLIRRLQVDSTEVVYVYVLDRINDWLYYLYYNNMRYSSDYIADVSYAYKIACNVERYFIKYIFEYYIYIYLTRPILFNMSTIRVHKNNFHVPHHYHASGCHCSLASLFLQPWF